ncbi:hypothetical protein [Salmonirosea aquatica]|uniref:Uncharacterized protein n=1 Tax=Salmonirosea aquatica TaxID=2654236 RepID=A0A7C9F2H9_9BACT|nr:hypothetical protein [Cytophagaceae bacterium SJW1-29]
MTQNGFIALRGLNSFHMVDRHIIKEVEVGAKHSRIVTPYHVIEVDTRSNMDTLSLLCEEAMQEVMTAQNSSRDLYPRLADLPF